MSVFLARLGLTSKAACNIRQFRQLSEQIAEIGKSVGVRVVPYRDSRLPSFSILDEAAQNRILENLRIYVDVCHAVIDSGGDLKDPVTITWSAIKELKLRPSSDLFTFIQPDHVIEFHDAEGIQIFRNFRFYEFCSYSLEELFAHSWNHLYTRDPRVIAKLMKVLYRFYNGEEKNTVRTEFGQHVIEELYSPFKYQIEAEMIYLSPLFDVHGRAVASVAIETGRVLGAPLSAEEEELLLEKFLNPLCGESSHSPTDGY